jgi:hypothetical protein
VLDLAVRPSKTGGSGGHDDGEVKVVIVERGRMYMGCRNVVKKKRRIRNAQPSCGFYTKENDRTLIDAAQQVVEIFIHPRKLTM